MRFILLIAVAATLAAGASVITTGDRVSPGAATSATAATAAPGAGAAIRVAVPSSVPPDRSAAVDPGQTAHYRPPVDAPVTDPFRAPDGPYGAGNRGLEYATSPGSPARAIGDGTVAFSGSVAGRWVVSIVHPDGLRSSLTGLGATSVQVGDVVVGGDVVGTMNASLHLGVRRGEDYIDPASIFAAGGPPRHAVLVPVPR